MKLHNAHHSSKSIKWIKDGNRNRKNTQNKGNVIMINKKTLMFCTA